MFGMLTTPIDTIRTKQLMISKTIQNNNAVVFETSDLIIRFTIYLIYIILEFVLLFEIE
jgi:hypothetical protein